MKTYTLVCAVVVLHLAGMVHPLDNGLGKTPQMGWNSWNHFACNINENVIKATAKAMVDTGLAKAGYTYVNIDDCWAKSRDSNGFVHEDPATFPSGMKALGDYIHSLGLKFGIYSDAGYYTCAGRPGSLGYEKQDAESYASWGVDYLKYDNCNSGSDIPEKRYPVMRDALNATGRPIFFSLCEWGVDKPATWAREVGNSWRTTDDIQDNWTSMLSNLDNTAPFADAAGPGGWNDPDMLEVGNGGLTMDENVAHFSLWAITKAPLLIGNDVTKMTTDILNIMTNTEVNMINQDPLGVQAKRITSAAKSVSNAKVIVAPCEGKPEQQWMVNDNDRTIVNKLSNTCLDIPQCNNNNGIQLEVFTCHVGAPNQECDAKNQQWEITNSAITSVFNNKCLNVWNNAGPTVIMWDCAGSSNERWVYNTTTKEFSNAMKDDGYYGGCLTVQTFTDQEVWAGPLEGKAVAVALFNRGDAAASITANWSEIGLPAGQNANVRDVWAKKDLGVMKDTFSIQVPPHAARLFKLTPK